MPPVRSLKKITPKVWVPPSNDIEFKIEIVDISGTIYDITDEIVEGEYTDGVTETIGNFTFKIDNTNQDFTDKFSLYDQIKMYTDYDTSATTLRFTGLLEKVSTKGQDIVVSGRSITSRVMGITVTKAFDNQYTHDIIESLISIYASSILTTTNIDTTESTDVRVSFTWNQKPFWECIQELCNSSDYDSYVDASSDFHYFVKDSIQSTTESVVHDFNLEEVGDFTPDLTKVRNRIIVYGAKVEEQQIIWTEEDTDSIALYDVRELIITDSNIITVEQAQARAVYELNVNKDPPIIGDITSLGLATILPGEQIRISDQDSKLNGGYYSIQKFTQRFSSDDVPLTILTIKKEENTLSRILKKRISFESESIEKNNLNEMRFSWLFTYNTDSGTHIDDKTEITNGVLKTQTGQSSGTWNSETNIISSTATEIELRVKGESLIGTTYEISTNGGIKFQAISNLNTSQVLSPPGSSLVLRVNINSESTIIDSLILLYKTT